MKKRKLEQERLDRLMTIEEDRIRAEKEEYLRQLREEREKQQFKEWQKQQDLKIEVSSMPEDYQPPALIDDG